MSSQVAEIAELDNMASAVSERLLAIPVKQSWGAFILAFMEAICVFYMTAAKAGLALAAASIGASSVVAFIHKDIFRMPILVAAVIGVALNLYLLWLSQKLRTRPSAAWRKRPLTGRERLRIGAVLFLSLLTLVMTAVEIYGHRLYHHSLF